MFGGEISNGSDPGRGDGAAARDELGWEREPVPWREGSELSVREFSEGARRHDSGTAYGAMPPQELRLRHENEYIEPMSRPHSVEPFMDPELTVRKINPDFEYGGDSYGNNCADCARCFEATWRGEAQEAAGRAPELTGLQVEGEYSNRTEEWAGETFRDVEPSDLRHALERGGHGSSAIVHTQFVKEGSRGGHAYNVVNHHGEIQVVDGQTGDVLPYSNEHVMPDLGETTDHRAMAWDANGKRLIW